MTGYSDEKLNPLDFSGEQVQFMTKPFTPADLAILVQKCLSDDPTAHGERME
jgi:DNA-binding NtrC family response regulator